MATPRFPLGQTVATPGALETLEQAGQGAAALLARHQSGDWGDVPEADKRENELSLKQGFRLLSAYTLTTSVKVWVITESDRSATTILLPSEYSREWRTGSGHPAGAGVFLLDVLLF